MKTRLYIDIRQTDNKLNPYELSRKMSSLLEKALNSSVADFKNLRMGNFHPADKTEFYYKYLDLTKKMLNARENNEKEDDILDEMDDVWWKMPDEERKLCDREIRYKKEDLPLTKFKEGQIVGDNIDRWKIISINDNKMIIKVLNAGPDKIGSIGSYLDVGKEYVAFRHSTTTYEVWEIDPLFMKRNFSQVLLIQFEEGDEPIIDLS